MRKAVSTAAVLFSLIGLGGVLASLADAAEWHTNGPLTFSSTNAGQARFVIHNGGAATVLQCTSTSITGTLRGPTIAGSTAPGIATVTPVFSGPCTVSGAAGYSVSCAQGEVNALSYSGGTTAATAGTGNTTMTHNFHCTTSIGAVACSTTTGFLHEDYINRHLPLSLILPAKVVQTSGAFHTTKIGAGCAALPNGTTTFGSPGAGSTVTNITYTIDGASAPFIFRTP